MQRSAPTVDKFTDADGNFHSEAFNNAVNSYNQNLKELETELDNRINVLARGEDNVRDGDGNVNDGATSAISNLADEMNSIVPKANRLGHKIDSDYADIEHDASTNAKVSAGQAVKAGDVLVVLPDRYSDPCGSIRYPFGVCILSEEGLRRCYNESTQSSKRNKK